MKRGVDDEIGSIGGADLFQDVSGHGGSLAPGAFWQLVIDEFGRGRTGRALVLGPVRRRGDSGQVVGYAEALVVGDRGSEDELVELAPQSFESRW